ncbi:hypothetical protein K8Q94_02690 [Candidatus Nomurabacteria bacterium]|nr:hypothetical protein [Candidatus Nomurabacteria bacterium]
MSGKLKNKWGLVLTSVFVLLFFYLFTQSKCNKKNKEVINPVRTVDYPVEEENKRDTICFEHGMTLCKDLHLSNKESIIFAKQFGFKYFYQKDKLIVIVQTGTCFAKGYYPIKK